VDAETEKTLIHHAQRGEPDAIRQLYRAYFDKVYGYIAYRVGRAQDAEDLVSDTFLRAIENLGNFEFRGGGSFAAWLFRIAINAVNTFYRPREPEYLSIDSVPLIESSELPPDLALLQKEKFALLHHLIGTLSPRRRDIITLRFFGGLRNRDIAETLGLDERTVASHLCRGLEDLQRKYEAYDAPETTINHYERS
jgi:RNA polymerase sigma-70 factor (ECF subfamily)